MRILHVIDTLEFGGAEKVLVALANGFASQHEVSICCISRSGPLASELDPRIKVICMGRGAGNDYLLPWRLARHISQARYDVVHTHNWGVFLEGGIASWLARTPVAIHTVHGPYAPHGPGWVQSLKRLLRHSLERLVARGFRRVVAVSDSIRDYIPKTVGIRAGKLSTVRNGIVGAAVSAPRTPDTLSFITVGRLDAIKNHEMMIDAFARVAKALPQAHLTIVGDGPRRQAIDSRIEQLGLRSRVAMLGFRTDVAELLARADVFLLSSRYEGISIALLEAMRAGLPTVATNVGGVPETVLAQRTGMLVEPGDTEAFAQAMRTLATAPDRRRAFGAAAQALQQQEFSLGAMLARYSALYASPDTTV
ncbi:MAG: glycosyltransferase [Burkholderiaceae bacterium]